MKDKKDKKEKKDKMSPSHEAKRNVLQHLSDSMRRQMGEGIKDRLSEPTKKVSVEAPDAESLKKGLDLASELAPEMDKMSKVAGDIMSDDMDTPEVDRDEEAMDYEAREHEMPEDHASLTAIQSLQDENNVDEMDKIKKALSKKVKV